MTPGSIWILLSSAAVTVIVVEVCIPSAVARMVVSDSEAVETTFIEKGIPHAITDVAVVELGDASFFADSLAALLEAETNVHFCYPLMSRPNDRPALVFYLDDVEFGQSVLSASGFKLLYQGDLSR